MADKDYEELKMLFPEIKDWFHINGKFVITHTPEEGEWLIGQDRRDRLTELGFQWEIRSGRIWIQDR